MVRQADALSSAAIRRDVGLLALALPHVGHYQTRNRGTLGGSVAHADPSAEIPLVLATLGGEIELRSARRVRRVAAKQFFRSALVTIRGEDELITALHWPRASSDLDTAFFEFAVREGDFAIVAVACAFERHAGRMRLGFGGCGEVPQVIEVSAPSGTNANWVEEIARDLSKQLDYRSRSSRIGRLSAFARDRARAQGHGRIDREGTRSCLRWRQAPRRLSTLR